MEWTRKCYGRTDGWTDRWTDGRTDEGHFYNPPSASRQGINNLDQVIWLAENWKWVCHLNSAGQGLNIKENTKYSRLREEYTGPDYGSLSEMRINRPINNISVMSSCLPERREKAVSMRGEKQDRIDKTKQLKMAPLLHLLQAQQAPTLSIDKSVGFPNAESNTSSHYLVTTWDQVSIEKLSFFVISASNISCEYSLKSLYQSYPNEYTKDIFWC